MAEGGSLIVSIHAPVRGATTRFLSEAISSGVPVIENRMNSPMEQIHHFQCEMRFSQFSSAALADLHRNFSGHTSIGLFNPLG